MAEIRKWWEVPEWIDFGHTPVFVDGDTLRVSGDKTATYTVNRRIRVTGTTPFTIYGTITAVAYNAPNTDIEITFDSGSIDSTVNTMAVGAEVTNKAIGSDAIKYRNGSIPEAAVNLTPFTIFTGCMVDYAGLTAPSGWLLCSGLTIGNASSSATGRANADTSDLFTLLWNSFADAELPVSGGRGANAAADYAANKTITLPDLRGRVTAGQDDMGGTSANRITTIDGDVMGMTGGAETHTLDITQIPAHTHDITAQTLRSFAGVLQQSQAQRQTRLSRQHQQAAEQRTITYSQCS